MRRELFHDGYRDPGDDAHRMVYYVSWTLGFFGSLVGIFYCLFLLISRRPMAMETFPGEATPDYTLPWLGLGLSLLTMLLIGIRAFPEIRRLRKQRITADALVAGGFLAGLAMIFLGMERNVFRGSQNVFPLLGLIGLGLVVLVGSLVVGLILAFAPKLSVPKTVLATVETRYAIDKRLMEIEDHPDPAGEECIPMVRLRTSEGKELTLRAHPEAYEMAAPGTRGTARIVKGRLHLFRPSRHP